MRSLSLFFLLLLLMIFIGCNSSENSNPEYTVYQGATLFDGTGKEIPNSSIIIREGRIEAVGNEDAPIPDNAEIIEVSGKYIIPGLIDAHVHFSQNGFFNSRPHVFNSTTAKIYQEVKAYQQKHPERYFESFLRSGVTGVYDVGGPPWTISLQQRAEKDINAPHVAASGTLITNAPTDRISQSNPPVEKELIHISSDSLGRKIVQYNTHLGSTGIKILGIHPDDKVYMKKIEAIADETEKMGNKLIVHASTLSDAKAALEVGAKVLVHSVWEKEVDEEFINLIKKQNAIYTPTLVVSEGNLRSYRSLEGDKMQINDKNNVLDDRTRRNIQRAADFFVFRDTTDLKNTIRLMEQEIKKVIEISLINLKKLYQSGVLIAVGTDAGNPGTFHGISIYDELEKMQQAGIPASDLIVMATRNGAMAMERIDDIGTLEKGKMADLIILDKDPSEDISNMRSITHVMRGGLLRPVNESFK